MFVIKNMTWVVGVLSLILISSCTELKLVTGEVHHATCASPQSGSIDQTLHVLNPESLNITHTWSNGATTLDISGLRPIYPDNYRYQLSIATAGQPLTENEAYDVLYQVDWKTLNQITTTGTSITNAANGLADASSSNVLPANAWGYLEFTVGHTNALGNYDGGRMGLNPLDQINSGLLNNFNGFWFITGMNIVVVVNNGSYVAVQHYSPNDKFQISYNASSIRYYKNGSQIFAAVESIIDFSHPEMYVKATLAGNTLMFKDVNATFGCTRTTSYYADVIKEMDGSCYYMSNNIRIKYREKYNDNTLNYKVYNWKREPVLSFPGGNGNAPLTSNATGINYLVIPVGNKLLPEDVYTLEVKDAKNEVYKMRFKYNNYQIGPMMEPPTGNWSGAGPIGVADDSFGDGIIIGNDYK